MNVIEPPVGQWKGSGFAAHVTLDFTALAVRTAAERLLDILVYAGPRDLLEFWLYLDAYARMGKRVQGVENQTAKRGWKNGPEFSSRHRAQNRVLSIKKGNRLHAQKRKMDETS